MKKDLTGCTFSKLTAICPSGLTASGNTIWLCKCECGGTRGVINTDLTRGRVKSCGCGRNRSINKVVKNAELKKFKVAHKHMLDRVLGDRPFDAQYYKGRINICKKWMIFDGFYEDMYVSFLEHYNEYGSKHTTLDRIDNNGDYCKENCKWATLYEQVENRRNQKTFRAISPNGEIFISKNQRKFAREHNISSSGINACINGRASKCCGWTFEMINE